MLMLIDSDFDDEEIEILNNCMKKAKKQKRSDKISKKISARLRKRADKPESPCQELQYENEHLVPCKRKSENANIAEDNIISEPDVKKKKMLNSRLERLIKTKNRRIKIPNDPKFSPLFTESEMKWSTFELNASKQSTENCDSGIESPGSHSSTITSENVQLDNSIYLNEKYQDNCCELEKNQVNCELCFQKFKYTCTCVIQNSKDSEKIKHTCDIEVNTMTMTSNPSTLPSQYNIPPPDMIVALDCEFVGVHPKDRSALGRCSIVDFDGNIIFDKFVKPEATIVTYRTRWSGIRKRDMRYAIPFQEAQKQIQEILQDKIVVGHAVYNDFKVMQIRHSGKHIRDTSGYKPLRTLAKSSGRSAMSLKKLSEILLGRSIQHKEHCSVEDCRATLDLYKLVRNDWEQSILEKEIRRQTRNSQDSNDSNEIDLNCNGQSDDNSKTFLSDEFWPQYLFPSDMSKSSKGELYNKII